MYVYYVTTDILVSLNIACFFKLLERAIRTDYQVVPKPHIYRKEEFR